MSLSEIVNIVDQKLKVFGEIVDTQLWSPWLYFRSVGGSRDARKRKVVEPVARRYGDLYVWVEAGVYQASFGVVKRYLREVYDHVHRMVGTNSDRIVVLAEIFRGKSEEIERYLDLLFSVYKSKDEVDALDKIIALLKARAGLPKYIAVRGRRVEKEILEALNYFLRYLSLPYKDEDMFVRMFEMYKRFLEIGGGWVNVGEVKIVLAMDPESRLGSAVDLKGFRKTKVIERVVKLNEFTDPRSIAETLDRALGEYLIQNWRRVCAELKNKK